MTNKEMTEDLKALYEIIDEYVTDKNDHHFSMSHLGGVIESLEKQPLQGWISVEDALPEESGDYIVQGTPYIHVAYFNKCRNRFSGLTKITAWMPLPPEFESKEES